MSGLLPCRQAVALFGFLLGLLSVMGGSPTTAQAQTATVGDGLVWLAPKPNESVKPKPAQYRSGDMLKRAVTTNTWYSSVVYETWSDVLHAHPLTFKATPNGMEMGMPQGRTGPISALKNWAQGSTGITAVTYNHRADFTLKGVGFQPVDARLHQAGDWNIAVDMRQDQNYLRSHILHGSPYGVFEVSNGRVHLQWGPHVSPAALPVERDSTKQVHYFRADRQLFGVYLPADAQITATPGSLAIELPPQARFMSIGALPNAEPATRQAYATAAFVRVDNTEAQWHYDEDQSLVTTRYVLTTQALDGVPAQALMGLYPHHQQALAQGAAAPLGTLPSVRGPIAITPGDHFTTQLRFNGLLPFWPKLQNPASADMLKELLVGDRRRANSMFGKMGNGTYWTGKSLGAIAQVMSIAEQHGEEANAAELEKILKQRMESWFSGRSLTYFAHEPGIGTLLGYPEEYFSVSAMNDHHFHYGYWIMAAAHLARRDPQWASKAQWGGWARGNSEFFGLGNDQESSSEAIHAWAAIAQWGEVTQQPQLKALGVYLYATEVSSVLNYWFDMHRTVFHPDYGKPIASMVFGGGYGYSTWWTEEPRQIMGINLLPITPASTYLAKLPTGFVESYASVAEDARKAYDQSGQSDGTPKDIWQDIYASLVGLKNPALALKTWNSKGSVELGETRSHTHFWIHALNELGAPDTTVWANTMTHAVFKHTQTGQRTYVAYNPSDKAAVVRFSDGVIMRVEPKKLERFRPQ
ncbi:MAG: hypothetical protein EBU72_12640 [Betaproteobacteria bacterium]|nr:hypothetical protein [Betaproteobacteria bacterium]